MANTGVSGRVVDAVTKAGIPGLTVKAYDVDPLAIENHLGTATTGPDGRYTISYSPGKYRIWLTGENPDIEVRVFGAGDRLLHETLKKDGVTDAVLPVPNIEIHASNIRVPDKTPDNPDERRQDPYWLVTHTTLDPTNGTPVRLTSGNQIEWLVDGSAMFPAVNEDARRGLPPRPVVHTPPPPPPPTAPAVASIKLINMAFEGELASHFTFPPGRDYKSVASTDLVVVDRLGEILKAQAAPPHLVPVNVLVWELENDIGSGFFGLFDKADGADELREFFQNSHVRVGTFKSTQLLHIKFILLDGKIAYLVGSTMKQGYFSGQDHLLRDGQHGVQSKESRKGDRGLLHDASLKVEGPCVQFIDQTFSTIWSAHNEFTPAPAPPTGPVSGPSVAAVQLLRTLPGNVFTEPQANAELLPHGETGVLEAYQRAIMKAEEYIYIEDQYFNSEEIVEAIKARMVERPQLEVIIVINPRPDIGGYHPHQTRLINDLIKAGGEDRVAVFTMWSCDTTNPKLEVAPIYVHSKVCIIDDRWVAIGTANVDGASMNARQWKIILPGTIQEFFDEGGFKAKVVQALLPLIVVLFLAGFVVPEIGAFLRDAARREFARFTQHANPNREQQPPRHPEIVLVVYDGIAGQPASGKVKELRNILWTEHLGAAPPDPRPPEGWVGHWKHQAFLYLQKIRDGAIFGSPSTAIPAKVLKWSPERDFEKNLDALGVATGGIRLKERGETMPFQFSEALP
jgi:phosphatidylserine/phosphatidylglycerophosphate/cardiolipin synthase-like enzyme